MATKHLIDTHIHSDTKYCTAEDYYRIYSTYPVGLIVQCSIIEMFTVSPEEANLTVHAGC